MKRCTSEPSLQQWASDGLQGLGEPSWVTLSRSSDGGSGRRGQQQQQGGGAGQDGSSGSSGAGAGVGDSTVHALESDLKKTARLYPPGRWAEKHAGVQRMGFDVCCCLGAGF
jgi:hypothetical protein